MQSRRAVPTRITLQVQIIIQNRVIKRVLGGVGMISPPLLVRFLARFPILSRIPARLIGIEFRPEHVKTPAELPPGGLDTMPRHARRS